jgi:WD40 repeat protein
MVACRAFLCGSVLLLLTVSCLEPPPGVSGSDSPPKQAPRVDAFGDPLPEGAIARIGTVRLRQPSEVCSVVYSPDGKMLATGGRYDGVRLWDATTGKLLRFLPADGGQSIFGLAFAPDSKTLVSSGTDGALEVWDVATGKNVRQLASRDRLRPLCFSDDGKLLAAADRNGMRVWKTADWTEADPARPEDRKVIADSFAGKRLYVGNERGYDYLWDLATLEKQVVPQAWRTGYWTALSPDGKRLASSGLKAPVVVLRDVATGKEQRALEFAGKKDATVDGLCYSPDGKLLAVGGRGTPVRCINVETGKETVQFGDQEVDYTPQLAFSPDGKRLAAARGHSIRLWEVGSGKETLGTSALLHGIQATAFSPSGKQLAFSDGEWLRMYDAVSHKEVWRCLEERDNAYRIAFAPDGNTLVAGGVSRLRFLDARNGQVMYAWGSGLLDFTHVGAPVEFGLFTPDLTTVVSMQIGARDPGTAVAVLSAASSEELVRFHRTEGSATAASISPDAQLLAIGNWEGACQLYHLPSGKSVARLDVTGTKWHRLVFAPDGRSLVMGDRNGNLQLLEVATGKPRLAIQADVDGFVFTPQGNVLATLGNERNTRRVDLWDTLTGRKLGQLQGHDGRITQIAFAPGGTLLATASEDTTILLWDVADMVRTTKPIPLNPEALATAWKDLASPDAAQADRAMASFRHAEGQAVEYLRERLRPEPVPAAKQVERWVADLDHDAFAVREEAEQELRKHLDVVAPVLRKALAANPAPELRKRLAGLIELAEEGRWTPEGLRALRAIEILERVGSTAAQKVLETLVGGAPEARLTREAVASLKRLTR